MIAMTKMRAAIMASTAVLLLQLPLASAGAADTLLKNLAGNWTGTGSARQSADSTPEPIKCRIEATIDATSRKLAQTGRCATADRTSTIVGEINHDPENGGYSGRWSTRADGRTTALVGKRVGKNLHLTASAGEAGSVSTIVLTPSGADGYVMVMSKAPGPDGKGGEQTEIRFTRR